MLENNQTMGMGHLYIDQTSNTLYEDVQRLNTVVKSFFCGSDITAIKKLWLRCPFATSAESVVRFWKSRHSVQEATI